MTSKNGVHDFFFCASCVEEEKNPQKPLRLFPSKSLYLSLNATLVAPVYFSFRSDKY
jgi:hypothetical protein